MVTTINGISHLVILLVADICASKLPAVHTAGIHNLYTAISSYIHNCLEGKCTVTILHILSHQYLDCNSHDKPLHSGHPWEWKNTSGACLEAVPCSESLFACFIVLIIWEQY